MQSQNNTKTVKVGDYVIVKGNAIGTAWESGKIMRIENGRALIAYGSKNTPDEYKLYGYGIMPRLEELIKLTS